MTSPFQPRSCSRSTSRQPVWKTSLLIGSAGFISLMGLVDTPWVIAQGADPIAVDTVPAAEPTTAPAEAEAPIEPAAPVEAAPPVAEESLPTFSSVSTEVDPIAPEPTVTAGSESFIDTTGYGLGATDSGSSIAPSPLKPAAPGTIGAVQLPESGDALTIPSSALPEAIAPPSSVHIGGLSVTDYGTGLGSVGRTASLQDYYNRTIRPPARLGNGNLKLLFPLSIPAPITSAFGWRIHPIANSARFHAGTDLGAPMGTPVVAAYGGKVAIADFMGGYGLTVTIQHNNGTQETLYAHLSEIFVKPGDLVQQGAAIGRVGSTGASTGPHLHFEFRQMTSEGWVAMDAGQHLEYSLAQFVKSFKMGEMNTALGQFNGGLSGTAIVAMKSFTLPIASAPNQSVLLDQKSLPIVVVPQTQVPTAPLNVKVPEVRAAKPQDPKPSVQ